MLRNTFRMEMFLERRGYKKDVIFLLTMEYVQCIICMTRSFKPRKHCQFRTGRSPGLQQYLSSFPLLAVDIPGQKPLVCCLQLRDSS